MIASSLSPWTILMKRTAEKDGDTLYKQFFLCPSALCQGSCVLTITKSMDKIQKSRDYVYPRSNSSRTPSRTRPKPGRNAQALHTLCLSQPSSKGRRFCGEYGFQRRASSIASTTAYWLRDAMHQRHRYFLSYRRNSGESLGRALSPRR